MEISYRLVNVFTDGDDPFSGNAVAVFEDASQLSTYQMQALSTEVNQETVFILPTNEAPDAQVRFFSPQKETGFAGSASLATAHVLRNKMGGSGDVRMREVQHGDFLVRQLEESRWEFGGKRRTTRSLKASPQILASLVSLPVDAIAADPITVETQAGSGGIILPVRSVEDVRETRLDARLLHSYAMLLNTEPSVYVWAWAGEDKDRSINSRMFYGPRGGVLEVAATGSGAANLGAWFAAQGRAIKCRITQGRPMGRRSHVDLHVNEEGNIFVGGRTREVSHGVFNI